MSGSPVAASPSASPAGLDRPTAGYRRAAIAIILLALLLRVAWAAMVPVVPISDGHAYDIFARNLAAGVGFGFLPATGDEGLEGRPHLADCLGPHLLRGEALVFGFGILLGYYFAVVRRNSPQTPR